MKNDCLAAVIEDRPVGTAQAESHIPAATAFPDIGRDLVHSRLENSAVQLLAICRRAAAGGDQCDALLVHINPDRVIAGCTHLDRQGLAGDILNIGCRHRHDIVVAGEAKLPDHRIEVHEIHRHQVRALLAQKVNAHPGRNLADLRVTKPAPGLSQDEVDIPFFARAGILLTQVIGSHPIVSHAEGATTTTAGVLVKKQQVPGVGLNPARGIHPGGERIQGVNITITITRGYDLSERAFGLHIENLALEIIVLAGTKEDQSEILTGRVIEPDTRRRINHSKPEIPAAAALPDIGRDLVHSRGQLSTVSLLAISAARTAAGGFIDNHVIVHINPDGIVTGCTELHQLWIARQVLDIGRRDTNLVVGPVHHRRGEILKINQVSRWQVITKGAQVIEGKPGRGVIETARPSQGLGRGKINIPLFSCPGVFFGHIVG